MVKGNGPITKLPGTKLALVSQLPTQNLSHPNEHGAAWLWSQKTTNLKRKRKKPSEQACVKHVVILVHQDSTCCYLFQQCWTNHLLHI